MPEVEVTHESMEVSPVESHGRGGRGLVGRCFGLLNFSKLLGLLMSGFAIGVFGGPVLAGKIFDTMGDYRIALIIFGVGFVVAALAVSFVKPGKYNDEFVQG